jgi:predicted permease
MSVFLQDFQYVLRALLRRPVYAIITVIVFSLAIGANTTVFSVSNGFFLRPLPYPDDDELVVVFNAYPKMGLSFAGTSIPDYLDRRERAGSLEELAIFSNTSRTLGRAGESPEQLLITRVSPSFFDVMGVPPVLGRGFSEEEAVPGNERVIVLSNRLWTTRFGASDTVLGTDIELDGERFRVVGVMPESFVFPDRSVDAWMPFAFTAEQMSDNERGNEFSGSVGRLRPGGTIAALSAELEAIVQDNLDAGRLQDETFIETTGFTGRAQSLRERMIGDYKPILAVLHGIVLAVLLIACANVANLQLARMATRRKELATRIALGASSRRLAWLVLLESLVLALLGAVAGTAFAVGGLELVEALGIDHTSQGFEFALEPTVLGFSALAALVAAFASAALPLLALHRTDLARAVHESGRSGSAGRRAHGFRSALVVVQLSVSVALLVGAGLLTKSFYRMQQAGTGFNIENVWTARIALPGTRYDTAESRALVFERALEELAALPGVIDAGFTSSLPFTGNNWQGSYAVDGYTPPAGVAPPHAQHRAISEGFLPSLDIPVIRGRNFTATETERVAIVDENLADKYWPDGDAIGQRIAIEFADSQPQWHTVIGVVPAIKHASLTEDPSKETAYWHYKQQDRMDGVFTLRTTLDPQQLSRVASDTIARIDPELVLTNAMTMKERVTRSLGPQRTPMVLTLAFAAIALTLAIIGIYGVLTWSVTQRFGEFGVRMALGARGHDIVRMVLTQGGRLIVIGLAVGFACAIVLGRAMSSQIYEVSAADPTIFAIALAGLAGAALFASWLPAQRAARIDPMHALRDE